jgi:hypothetical protein
MRGPLTRRGARAADGNPRRRAGKTGRPVAEWAKLGKANSSDQNDPVQQDPGPAVNCDGVMTLSGRFSPLRPLKVPGRCWHLHHPNVSFCGPGHATEPALTRIRDSA